MYKSMSALKALLFLLSIFSMPSVASAQATRTWVSGVGDDVNPCSRTAPCKTFAGAIFKTAVGGEINALDGGGFGAVTISKSITIDGTGTFASILAASVNGIIINITSATDTAKTVRLRGLAINGASTGIDGIRVTSALEVFVQNVVIDGFTRHGINVAATGSKVFVKGATVRKVSQFGINLEPGGNAPNASLLVESSSLLGSRAGIFTGAGTRATIRDSAMMGNETGLAAEKSDVTAVNCVFGENGRGVVARQGSNIRLSLATVTNNQVGLTVDAGGKIISFKNNGVHGNVQDGAVSTTVLPI